MNKGENLLKRHEIWKEYSKGQVNFLSELRDELSSKRWEIMLEVDGAKRFVKLAISKAEDREMQNILKEVFNSLENVHSGLSRIPEDFIPAF